MKILAIDTSCDETAAAVTENDQIISNIIWSQASSHANFGGVMPSLAQRMHQERIDFVIEKALKTAKVKYKDLDAVAVTFGPGLSIALGVGVAKAKEIAEKNNLPLIPINHIEAHLLSSMAKPSSNKPIHNSINFPAYGLVVSGGNTIFFLINKIGSYEILAETQDDALGEALDKAARMVGFGYPGGSILEKMAKLNEHSEFSLPIPLVGQEKRRFFSYSGLKTSLSRYIDSQKKLNPNYPSKKDTYALCAEFQKSAFKHLERTISFIIKEDGLKSNQLLLGGGVGNNLQLRKELRKLGNSLGFKLLVPYSKKLYGDNAGMIGVCAYTKYGKSDLKTFFDLSKVDRNPRARIV